MAHKSGIKPTADLVSKFNSSNSRALKITIDDETLVLEDTLDSVGLFDADFSLLKPWTSDFPCFILYRLDKLGASGSAEWVVFQYVPDRASVRDKMIYASTKNGLLKELGEGSFVHTIFCTVPDEVTLSGYSAYLDHVSAENPLSEREQEKQQLRREEVLRA